MCQAQNISENPSSVLLSFIRRTSALHSLHSTSNPIVTDMFLEATSYGDYGGVCPDKAEEDASPYPLASIMPMVVVETRPMRRIMPTSSTKELLTATHMMESFVDAYCQTTSGRKLRSVSAIGHSNSFFQVSLTFYLTYKKCILILAGNGVLRNGCAHNCSNVKSSKLS